MVKIEKKDFFSSNKMDLFLNFVRKYRGIDLTSYRKSFLTRRLKLRLSYLGLDNLLDYIQVLKKQPQEWNNFLNNLSINVSELFRDPEVFAAFRDICIPSLIERKRKQREKTIRCWSCGCSCGEEPYSLAIIFLEKLKNINDKFALRIYATDIDEQALKKAREGIYPERSLKNAEPLILNKYFTPLGKGLYQVKDTVKEVVTFRKHNLLLDSPLKFIDVVFFRNVRIYFSLEESERILLEMYNSLKEGGYLVLGKVENLSVSLRNYFKSVSLPNKIFIRI
ncbi:MAG: protein-glutamate O-methyltransferase CheR [Candidatus Omnitrophota bacterium]|nr:MAG: protein-glutamate O-methyltransferase CheR [Candidatus Omnitrophota bacterium]